MLSEFIKLFKKDPVFWIAGVLAFLSCFIVKPSASYADYIDVRTLVLLFSLMAVVAGFGDIGVFQKLSSFFIKKAGTVRKMCLVLVLLSFFLSMLVTNDVALITLVPLTIIIMHSVSVKHMEYTVILQTVAANLGSMMTPFGNPQNLYLYSFYEMHLTEFLKIVAAPGLLGLAAVVLLSFRVPAEAMAAGAEMKSGHQGIEDHRRFAIYCVLFVLCIATVLRFVPYYVSGAVVLAVMLAIDRRILLRVDYGLLITFIFFFIFVGNMGQIPAVSDFLTSVITGREILVSALVSQVISNVPAALLLSGFTSDGAGLILGTDIGGLGTLIASMASLISMKLYMRTRESNVMRFTLRFSVINFVLLAVMLVIFA